MRIIIKYPEAGTEGCIEEHDELLGRNSTVLDLKGLIKLWTGEGISKQVLLLKNNVVEDTDTLADLGIKTQADADSNPFSLILEEEEEAAAEDGEFTHEAFIRASAALGRGVPVTPDTEHEEQKRREAVQRSLKQRKGENPRVRPAKLNMHSEEEVRVDKSEVYKIYLDSKYGMRVKGMDQDLKVSVGGEDYEYWDLRLPESLELREKCNRDSEIVLEIFYFGELAKVSCGNTLRKRIEEKLINVVGISPRFFDVPPRDAGCMYPLIASPFVISHREAEKIGHHVFEHFGRPMTPLQSRPLNSGAGSACGTQ